MKLFILSSIICFSLSFSANNRHPVIFVPGDGGSQLEAKLDKEKSNEDDNCPTSCGWFRLWLDVWQLATTDRLNCWVKNIGLRHDFADGRNKNAEGVETRVPGWGETETVEYVDPSWSAWVLGDVGNVAATLVTHMTNSWGYKRGVDVRGAPYDFRFAPPSQKDFFERLKKLVEETVNRTGRRVVILTHSLGGIFALEFLKSSSMDWKRRFIHAFVPMGAPWAGSAVAFNLYIAGDARGIKAVDPKIIRDEQRSYETGVLLLPSRNLWSPSDSVFVETPTRRFTTGNYDRLFSDLKYPVGKINHDYVKNITESLPSPGVPVFCVFSYGIPTPKKFIYAEDASFLAGDQPADRVDGDGDGTVNLESLQLCRRWTERWESDTIANDAVDDPAKYAAVQANPKAEVKMFEGVTHADLLKDKQVFEYLESIFHDAK